jgi:hypothetical protein
MRELLREQISRSNSLRCNDQQGQRAVLLW